MRLCWLRTPTFRQVTPPLYPNHFAILDTHPYDGSSQLTAVLVQSGGASRAQLLPGADVFTDRLPRVVAADTGPRTSTATTGEG